ncbi:low molecular weight phosphatase family protein [Microbacterium oryzae]|uniref:arsenate reductase/protein-tyrosine-phosphatase family protein n=1 Tax=Microbacterium oryzae TaxID=743009 RepID=UPI0025B08CFA|nr:low molecular weight phosphatase family protein [Microbacterium oryzae]MDN3311622.1 low molecular weight phosphatase family protein [Microbacterium oryzae]
MLKIMTVCTGNICRSPLAEVLLRARLKGSPIEVVSRGTHALVDRPMTAETLERAILHGADRDVSLAHRGALLREDDLRDVDLVLAMTREHRAHVVDLAPPKVRSAFTLLEFARLARVVSDEELESAAADVRGGKHRYALMRDHLAALRGELGPLSRAAEYDVPDPYRRGDDAYDRASELLVPAVDAVTRVMRLAVSRTRA